MMSEVFINSIEGTVRRAQAYANIYEQVGFKPFYLSDFNDAADCNHQISSSMLSALHRFHLVRKTGNRREYDVFLGEWGGVNLIQMILVCSKLVFTLSFLSYSSFTCRLQTHT